MEKAMIRLKKVVYEDIKKDMYYCDEDGNIYNNKRQILKPSMSTTGYSRYSLSTGTINRNFNGHRIIANAYIPHSNDDNVVNHINAIKTDNRVSNLEWCTQKENVAHAINNNLMNYKFGEDCHNSVLTNDQVHTICRLLEKGEPYADILRMTGIEITERMLNTISKIKTKSIWKHISDQYNIGSPVSRRKAVNYTDDYVNNICRLIQQGLTNSQIKNELGLKFQYKSSDYNSITNLISKIRNRTKYTKISDNYKW